MISLEEGVEPMVGNNSVAVTRLDGRGPLNLLGRSVFNDLNDEQKEGIASTSMDSLKASFFEDSLTFQKIKSLPIETYESYQKISRDSLDIEQNLHIYRRLILILCLVLNSYLLFSKKYKFNITFQKAMFHNAIFSLIFSLFCIFSFILTQTIRGTVGDSSFMLQYGFAHFISILKSTLFWFVAVSFFIYFHPQNIDWYQRRMAKKKEKEAMLFFQINTFIW